MRLDLNSDVGEAFGSWTRGDDAALMNVISSANIACGFHAGDPGVMRETVALARGRGVAIGAHPGFPDLVGFGRRDLRCTPQEVEDFVVYQVGALAAVAAAQGAALHHVKPHGALYNMACRDEALATAIARAVALVDPSLALMGLPASALIAAGRRQGLRTIAEGFADRAYQPDGALVNRAVPGAVIHDPALVVERAVRIARRAEAVAIDGTVIPLPVQSLCVHGDTPGAAALAAAIRAALEANGVRVAAAASSTGEAEL